MTRPGERKMVQLKDIVVGKIYKARYFGTREVCPKPECIMMVVSLGERDKYGFRSYEYYDVVSKEAKIDRAHECASIEQIT